MDQTLKVTKTRTANSLTTRCIQVASGVVIAAMAPNFSIWILLEVASLTMARIKTYWLTIKTTTNKTAPR